MISAARMFSALTFERMLAGQAALVRPGANSAAIQAALDTGKPVFFAGGIYDVAGLTCSVDGQRLFSLGHAILRKNANGPILTVSAHDAELSNLWFAGVSASFTGDNIAASGNRLALLNCGSTDAAGRALKATGGNVKILGQRNIYATADASAAGYDIELGVSGTATLYHQLQNIYTSQATGGILLTDVGGHSIIGSQFGKLNIAAGTLPAGVNGGMMLGNRILGDVTAAISSSVFVGNQFGAVTVTLGAGTSGHKLDESNTFPAAGAAIVDNSTASDVRDLVNGYPVAYTPAWTGSVTDPAIGDGTITGRYIRKGRFVHAEIVITAGSTTTFGSGTYRFSLPFVPDQNIRQVGIAELFDSGTNFRVGTATALADGTARCEVYVDSAASAMTPTVPFTLANGDRIRISIDYML